MRVKHLTVMLGAVKIPTKVDVQQCVLGGGAAGHETKMLTI